MTKLHHAKRIWREDTSCGILRSRMDRISLYQNVYCENTKFFTMDVTLAPSTPEEIYQKVSGIVPEFHGAFKALNTKLQLTIKWKKEHYGCWFKLFFAPPKGQYCSCDEQSCTEGKYFMKELHYVVKSDFAYQALLHELRHTLQWCKEFTHQAADV